MTQNKNKTKKCFKKYNKMKGGSNRPSIEIASASASSSVSAKNNLSKYELMRNNETSDVISYIYKMSKKIHIFNDFLSDAYEHDKYPFVKRDLEKLDITNDLTTIKKIYNFNHYLELRKYNHEKKLIIGCGNLNGMSDGYLRKCTKETHDLVLKYHSHKDAFTIDLTSLVNPSIIGEFGRLTKFPTIPDNSFDIIIFEGGGDPRDNPEEIKRLLNKNSLSFCLEMTNYIYSYWREGKYVIQKKCIRPDEQQ